MVWNVISDLIFLFVCLFFPCRSLGNGTTDDSRTKSPQKERSEHPQIKGFFFFFLKLQQQPFLPLFDFFFPPLCRLATSKRFVQMLRPAAVVTVRRRRSHFPFLFLFVLCYKESPALYTASYTAPPSRGQQVKTSKVVGKCRERVKQRSSTCYGKVSALAGFGREENFGREGGGGRWRFSASARVLFRLCGAAQVKAAMEILRSSRRFS